MIKLYEKHPGKSNNFVVVIKLYEKHPGKSNNFVVEPQMIYYHCHYKIYVY